MIESGVDVARVATALSTDRLAPYLRAMAGDLRHAFPNLRPQNRATVYGALDALHTLRNRIAHHEPIHKRDLAADMLTIYRVLDWIDPDVRFWAVGLSRLQTLITSTGTPRSRPGA